MSKGSNQVSTGYNNCSCGNQYANACNCNSSPPTIECCDPVKSFNISQGMVSVVTCCGEFYNFPINVIDPKSNANRDINQVLFDICSILNEIQPNQVTSLELEEGVLTLTQSVGDTLEVNIPEFMETVTNVVINNDGFSYTNENGETVTYVGPDPATLVDNDDGTFTFTNEDGSVTIDYCNCPPISVTSADGSVTVVNTGTADDPVFDLSVTHTVDINTDFLSYDPVTKTITLTETDGTDHSINISDLVDAETVTTMVIQVDGSTVFTNENGDETVLPAPVTVKSTDGSASVQSTGTPTAPCYDLSVNFPQDNVVTSIPFDSNTNILTLAQSNGPAVTTDLSSLVSDPETVTSIVINPDGSFTHTNENNDVVIVPGTCNDIENFDDVGTVLPPLKVVTFDPVDGGCGIGTLPDITYTCNELLEELQNNPEKAAEFTAIIDIRAVGFNWNGATDIATIVMSDGSTLPASIDGLPVNGSYMPNSNGDVNIPLTNGTFLTLTGLVSAPDNDIASFTTVDNGDGTFTVTPVLADNSTLPSFTVGQDTISPADVDFANTTVTVAPNGETTITYLDSDGNVITTSVLAADMDDFLSGLQLGADGCTLTATLDSGANVSVDLCDLVSEVTQVTNPDGSIVTTHTAGDVSTSWTITPHPVYQRKDFNGAVTDLTTARIIPAAALMRERCIRNTVYQDWLETNGMCVEKCTYTDMVRIQVALDAAIQTVDSTTAIGTVLGEFCFTLNVPDCGRRVSFNSEHSLTMQDTTGYVTIRPRFSVDGGGTYANFATGGEDRTWSANGDSGEHSYTDFTAGIVLPEGANSICYQLVVERNTLTAGFASIGRANIIPSYTVEVCKTITP